MVTRTTSSFPDALRRRAGGLVITFENGFKIYYSSDTDVFATIITGSWAARGGSLDGDWFTYGARRAARRWRLA